MNVYLLLETCTCYTITMTSRVWPCVVSRNVLRVTWVTLRSRVQPCCLLLGPCTCYMCCCEVKVVAVFVSRNVYVLHGLP